MRSLTEFVILHHFGCLFLPEKAEVILYPSGTFSLCSCEQEEVPYVHVCVHASVHPWRTWILCENVHNYELMVSQNERLHQWQMPNAVDLWLSRVGTLGILSLNIQLQSAAQRKGPLGGREMGQRVAVGVVSDRGRHFSKNLLHCNNVWANGGGTATDFLQLTAYCWPLTHTHEIVWKRRSVEGMAHPLT